MRLAFYQYLWEYRERINYFKNNELVVRKENMRKNDNVNKQTK